MAHQRASERLRRVVGRTNATRQLKATEVEALAKSAFVGGAPGLQCLVSNNTKSWRLYYRLPGSTKRLAMKLGMLGDLSLADARQRAHEAHALAREGEDPKHARVLHAQTAILVDDALDEYLAFCEGENAPRTVIEKRIAFRNHIRPSLGKSVLRNLDSGDWLRPIDRLGKQRGARRSLYAYVRHFLTWAKERKHVPANPVEGVKPPRKLDNRERPLTEPEVRALWGIESVTADLARLSLVTAQRQASLGAMRWADLDLDKKLWKIPAANMKSGKAHAVPLSETAVEILSRQQRMTGDYVFGVHSAGEKPFNGFSNGMDALRKQLAGETSLQGQRVSESVKKARRKAALDRKAQQWRFHDLRHTAVTLAQEAAQPIDAIAALTQHKIRGTIRVYAHHKYAAEMRAVVIAIETRVLEILRS